MGYLKASAILLASTGLTLGAASASAETPAEPVRYSAEAFYDTTTFTMASPAGYGFSADGDTILISSDGSGVFNAYALPVAGGKPVAVTTSPDDATFAASYFPADDRVLFTADEGGNELDHVYVRELDGSVRDLNERNPEMFDVYAYDSDDYERRLVFENDGYGVGGISRDGRYVGLVKPRTSADSDLFLVDLGAASPEPKLITPHEGNISYEVYGFTPDSRSLVYATNETGEWNQAWTYDLATGEKKPLIQADWDVMFVSYSPSGRYRVSAINADASTELEVSLRGS